MKRAARNRNAVIHHVASRSGESGKPKWVIKIKFGDRRLCSMHSEIQRQTDALRIFFFSEIVMQFD
jgi:hypothetical protein